MILPHTANAMRNDDPVVYLSLVGVEKSKQLVNMVTELFDAA
jgi:hypothetical protein